MSAQVVPPYASLQRRLVAQRRSRTPFLPWTTQHVSSGRALLREVARLVLALAAAAAWGATVTLLAA